MHVTCEPPILYFGTPVVLISTLNDDGSPNLAPMSSAFWLGWRCMLGLAAASRTAQNLTRTRECVLNLPSATQVAAVDRLALTTGADPVPAYKAARGYRSVRDKFGLAGLSELPSETVAPPRVRECPVHLEGVLEDAHGVGQHDEAVRGKIICFEVRIQRVHIDDAILAAGENDRVDPDAWRPLIMSFQRFYGLGPELAPSALATIREASYRSPDVDRSRLAPRRASA